MTGKQLFGARFAILLSAIAFVGCAVQPSTVPLSKHIDSNGIIGGKEVKDNDPIVQSTVAIYAEQEVDGEATSFICTGTLVTANLVVTAAHCLGNETAQMAVIFGTSVNKDAPMLPVVAQAGHPRYDRIDAMLSLPPAERPKKLLEELKREGRGDIALIRFAGKIPTGFAPAGIARDLTFVKDGSIVTLAGFGRSNVSKDPKVDNGSGTLRRVDMPLAAVSFNKGEVLIDRVKGKSACMGDSGGPALVQKADGTYVVFGVTSAGLGEGAQTCEAYVAYTSIPAYFPWLERAAVALGKVNARDAVHGDKINPIGVAVSENASSRVAAGF